MSIIYSQETVNNRIEVDGVFASRITNIEPTDSCYYVCGVMTDSIGATGSFFGKLDLEGSLLNFKPLIPDTLLFEIWYNNLCKKGDLFYVVGTGYLGGGRRSCFLILNQFGEVELFKWIELPNHPFTFPSPQSMIPFEDGWLLVEFFKNPDRNRIEARILRLNNLGEIVWERFYKDSVYSFRPRTLTADSTGFFLGGGKGNLDYKLQDYFEQTVIVKYNKSGEFQWKFESQPDWTMAESIIVLEGGELIVGAKRGIPFEININTDGFNIQNLIFKLNSNHDLEWSRLMRNEYLHGFNNLEKVLDSGDGIVYCGHQIDETVGFLGVLGKVSYTGDSLWMREFSYESDTVVTYEQMLYDIERTPDGGFITVGSSMDNTPPQYQYGWILKVDEFGCLIPGCQLSTTKNISGETEFDLSIFPNPTSEYLNFLVKDPNLVQLSYRIITTEGKVVSTNETIKPNVTYIVPVHSWLPGTYHLQIFSKGKLLGTRIFMKG